MPGPHVLLLYNEHGSGEKIGIDNYRTARSRPLARKVLNLYHSIDYLPSYRPHQPRKYSQQRHSRRALCSLRPRTDLKRASSAAEGVGVRAGCLVCLACEDGLAAVIDGSFDESGSVD